MAIDDIVLHNDDPEEEEASIRDNFGDNLELLEYTEGGTDDKIIGPSSMATHRSSP